MKPILLRGRALNQQGLPLICVPLIARTPDALKAELLLVLAKSPDVIEWRVDFFSGIADTPLVLDTARMLRSLAGNTPILFTRRAAHEGGEPIDLAEEAVVALYSAICVSGAVDFIDYELSQDAAHLSELRAVSRAHGVGMIMSHHNFRATPASEEIVQTLTRAATLGADVAKVAVMPRSPADVVVLLDATCRASDALAIPVVTMSMGDIGAITRVGGSVFGSAMTFAVGVGSSAPGQLPVEELRACLRLLRPPAA